MPCHAMPYVLNWKVLLILPTGWSEYCMWISQFHLTNQCMNQLPLHTSPGRESSKFRQALGHLMTGCGVEHWAFRLKLILYCWIVCTLCTTTPAISRFVGTWFAKWMKLRRTSPLENHRTKNQHTMTRSAPNVQFVISTKKNLCNKKWSLDHHHHPTPSIKLWWEK